MGSKNIFISALFSCYFFSFCASQHKSEQGTIKSVAFAAEVAEEQEFPALTFIIQTLEQQSASSSLHERLLQYEQQKTKKPIKS